MKKTIYGILILMTLALLSYTGFYTYTHTTTPLPIAVATSTEEVIATASSTLTKESANTKILTTQTGKTITLTETNPTGQSLSTITILPGGFSTNTPIVIEKNKLTDSFLLDLNKDTFDELVIITTAQGSGSYGEATIYTTTKDKELVLIAAPEITEETTKKGGLFEGYTGHDTFSVVNGTLIREFPTSVGTNTQSSPTGPKKKIIYSLVEKAGSYTVTFVKDQIASTSLITSTSTTTPLPGR